MRISSWEIVHFQPRFVTHSFTTIEVRLSIPNASSCEQLDWSKHRKRIKWMHLKLAVRSQWDRIATRRDENYVLAENTLVKKQTLVDCDYPSQNWLFLTIFHSAPPLLVGSCSDRVDSAVWKLVHRFANRFWDFSQPIMSVNSSRVKWALDSAVYVILAPCCAVVFKGLHLKIMWCLIFLPMYS